jgi:predicted CXXCH cytochrome family protein
MRRLVALLMLLAASLPSGAADPDAVCAGCHQKIYDSYRTTPMARASGPAAEGLLPGEFTHALSGVHYRLLLRDGAAWLSYDRGQTLHGEIELKYFIGSGQRGRTYLFQKEGFWFESPINWYSKQRVWDMNPKSLDAREMPLTLKVDEACLHCHTSGVQRTLGAVNHFPQPPFLHGGIGCESCHGDATAHVASGGTGPVINPAKLAATKRDSVCLQCHLEGEMAVNKAGRSLADFHPGDDLSDCVTHFVRLGETGPNGRATSQWEALLQSACKRKSGDRLTCTTCHDPHGSPSEAERVTYFRNRCLTCHGSPAFVSKHHPDQPDCSACHMPREKTEDVAHEQVTDHRIQRRPGSSQQTYSGDLVLVGGGRANDREEGLAYFQLAKRGDRASGEKALSLLGQAEQREGGQPDPDLHTALGFMAQLAGDRAKAVREYQVALRERAADSTAAANLAVLEARSGDVLSAVRRLEGVTESDPGETAAAMDLAVIDCALGDGKGASQTLQRLLAFSPDDGKAREMLLQIEQKPERCGGKGSFPR